MSPITAAAIGGFLGWFLGWEGHKFYLRSVTKQIRRLRAKLRGK